MADGAPEPPGETPRRDPGCGAGCRGAGQATAEATAMVRRLSGADASWPLHDSYGLPLERIPDVIAHTVELIIRDLRSHVTDDAPT